MALQRLKKPEQMLLQLLCSELSLSARSRLSFRNMFWTMITERGRIVYVGTSTDQEEEEKEEEEEIKLLETKKGLKPIE